jgi:putative nucleotidyltransferase with HDIG domain
MFFSRQEFQGIASVLITAERSLALYPSGHPHIQQALEECFLHLRELLQRERQIPIVRAGREFVVGDLQIQIAGEALEELAQKLEQAGIEKLIFLEGLRQWEIQRFLRLLNIKSSAEADLGPIERALEEEGVEHILAGPLRVEPSEEKVPDLLVQAWEAYTAGLKSVRKLRHDVRANGTLAHLDETKSFVSDLVEVAMQETRPLLALQALKVHDDYSFTHSINVATLTLAMARGLNFGKYELREITLAALLHDIGKERVAGDLLRKSGRLDEDEWQQMQRHSNEGAKLLICTAGTGDLAPIVAYEHHLAQEREDASSDGWNLHIVSEMVTIADVYDALRSSRPYRDALPPHQAMEIMRKDVGTKFNTDIFTGFARMVGYYPPGTCVRLHTGELGVVCKTNPDDLERPYLLLVHDHEDRPLDPPRQIDLTERSPDAETFERSIVEVVDAESVGLDPFDYL